MNFLTLFTTALLAALASAQDKVPGNNPLTYCATHSENVHITNVDFNPNPPQRGHKFTLTANGTATKPVVAGQMVNIKVSYGWFTLINDKIDICGQLKEQFNQDCPSQEVNIVKEFQLPTSMPSGKYTLTADAPGLTCLQSVLSF